LAQAAPSIRLGMLGIAAYDSDDEPPVAPLVALGPPPPPPAAAAAPAAPGPAPPPRPKPSPRPRATQKKLQELEKEVKNAKSATAIVQVVRRNSDSSWDVRWCAEALCAIAKRSTARTRKEWATDKTVMALAEKLRNEIPPTSGLLSGAGDDADVLLIALEGLRRMGFQDSQAQRQALETAMAWLAAKSWLHPVRSLTRLWWLASGLKLEGIEQVPRELRTRVAELGGPDVALIVAVLRREGGRDHALLQKVAGRLKDREAHSGMSASDLVELAEGFVVLDMRDEGALRPLGQELLRRRGELTPDESHRTQNAFEKLKLPLGDVWMQPGTAVKRDGGQMVTTQAFAPQEGHEKKRRGNHDVERTSPPRVVRDYKMCSY